MTDRLIGLREMSMRVANVKFPSEPKRAAPASSPPCSDLQTGFAESPLTGNELTLGREVGRGRASTCTLDGATFGESTPFSARHPKRCETRRTPVIGPLRTRPSFDRRRDLEIDAVGVTPAQDDLGATSGPD